MATQEVKGEDYIVQFDPDSVSVYFQGELSLAGPTEYAPITNLLHEVAESEPHTMTIDMRNLVFVNSSGISMLSKFVLSMRKKKGVQLVVLGSKDMPWQGKSLKNLEKLLPGLKLEMD
ncbi:slr1659 superfamily regulator [Microcoleus sp. herbarium2]|uniref:slr1659 superfamily regulator n=1 Tax=Microcoleus sp. herbarium2 TaxID=3055433 RepID=UPI002FD4B710